MRLRSKSAWSLPEGLGTGTVRGPDGAQPARDDHTMSPDQDTAWVLGRGYIKLSPLLSIEVCCVSFT